MNKEAVYTQRDARIAVW